VDAIERLPTGAWTAGIDQNGDLLHDTFVADLTGLLDLGRWHDKIPDLGIIVRDEPLHPRYRKRATEREKQLGRRYQLIAINTRVGQTAGSTPATAPTSTWKTTSNRPGQSVGAQPVALPTLVDQRRVDPDRRTSRQSAALLPSPDPPRR
jgi:hypothetical protein